MRTLNAGALALQARAIAGEMIPVVPLVHFDLAVPQYWAVCGIPLVWDAITWESLEIAVSEIRDDATDLSGLQFTLPGVTESQLALAIAGGAEGEACTVYLAWVDPDTAEVVDAVQVWAGVLDVSGWQDGPEAAAHFTAEHTGSVALRPRISRYTNDEQQRLVSGDTSLDIDPMTDAAPLIWPAASFFKV